jgi:ABC-type lipoprotein release transport system permease subunit
VSKNVEKMVVVAPEVKSNAATAPKKKGSLISILSIVFGIILGVGVAYLQFQFEYIDNPSKYYDTQLHSYLWVKVAAVTVPWFLVFALGTPMVAFTYVAFKRLLKI